MAVPCEICHQVESKYKCSTCFCPYCSLSCWKRHKSEENCKVKENNQESNEFNNDKEKYFTEDTVSEDKLRQLGESKTLKNILNNRFLQNILIGVENATDPEKALKQAMKNPEFVEFVDECLKIVEDTKD